MTRRRAILGLILVCACGGRSDVGGNADATMDTTDEASFFDAPPTADVIPEACARVGKGPGFDSCCNGAYCNGGCSPAPYFECSCSFGATGGCPASEACCWKRPGWSCELPEDCVTCARVGMGAGIENCCVLGSLPRYCRGVCGDPMDEFKWCTCGSGYPSDPSISDGCRWEDQVCCPLKDGGTLCLDAATCP
jgi:hypothetical protein